MSLRTACRTGCCGLSGIFCSSGNKYRCGSRNAHIRRCYYIKFLRTSSDVTNNSLPFFFLFFSVHNIRGRSLMLWDAWNITYNIRYSIHLLVQKNNLQPTFTLCSLVAMFRQSLLSFQDLCDSEFFVNTLYVI